MDIEGEDSMDVAAHVEAKARLAKEAAAAWTSSVSIALHTLTR